ncbi:hypothetical protein LINGRAHAP2_LOCUS1560, partial [Linum grandiflorum]
VFFSSSERSSAENLFIQPILSFIQPIFSFGKFFLIVGYVLLQVQPLTFFPLSVIVGIAAAVDSFPPSLHPELF